ncbi:alpha/beta hydrolase [Roseibium aquae]|uniref:Alpha/beta hydrolase n=1 Tax=Roseibium aquae TaxID=1323746 RepID=A0A916T9A5_9HYPH|nr:alpha/beta fold hydrolase [Roseibium aquae]GGB34051.1 alpha/beta hydrolase [Roseibium aquae]
MTSGSFQIAWQEAGRGDPLVLLHGIGGGSASWSAQLEGLSDRYRVIAWDMPGYGASSPLDEVSFSALSRALKSLIDRLDLKKPHIVGHSIGGMVAQEFAAMHPDGLASLTLSATSPAFGRLDGDFQKQFVSARLAPLEAGQTLADIADSVIPELVGPHASHAAKATAKECMSRVPPETYRAMMACLVTFDRRAALTSIGVPTLLIAGETDTQAPAAMMEKMASKIPGARYVRLPGTGHLANIEHPAAFNAALLKFLTES